MNVFKPFNPAIPFFRSLRDYDRRVIQPQPPGDDPERRFPWLVEPGLQSIEVYESIIGRAWKQHLRPKFPGPQRVYIAEAGVVQPRSCLWMPPGWVPPSMDRRLRERRDVCFTLLSAAEDRAVRDRFEASGLHVAPCPYVATPLGQVMLARASAAARGAACVALEFPGGEQVDSQFPQSVLPPGVVRLGCDGVIAWSVPRDNGLLRGGLSEDDGWRVRVLWR
ncbi:hypothetical protein V2A60_000076 [Cordyceps javanica]